jgi:hypothetical protein
LGFSQEPLRPGSNFIDVTEYDVMLDGQTDDTAALQNIFDKAPENSVIMLRAGRAVLSGPLFVRNKTLSIQGGGPFSTVLGWRKPGGIVVTDSSESKGAPHYLEIRGLTFLADVSGAGTALSFSYDNDTSTPAVLVQDCTFAGADRDASSTGVADYWTKCISIRNARGSRIQDCKFWGVKPSNSQTLDGTTHIIHINGQSTNLIIENCWGVDSKYGVLVEGLTEGVIINKCFFVHNEIAYAFEVDGEPMFDVFQSHAASSRYGILIRNGRNCAISGCFIALRADIPGISEAAGIRIEGARSRQITISGTTLHFNKNFGEIDSLAGVDVFEASYVNLSGNIFRSVDEGIRVGASCSYVTAVNNHFMEVKNNEVMIDPRAEHCIAQNLDQDGFWSWQGLDLKAGEPFEPDQLMPIKIGDEVYLLPVMKAN